MLQGFIPLLILIGIVGLGVVVVSSLGKETKSQRRRCSKDPSKLCPYTVEITSMGGMKASGHFGCCKIIDQLKAMNDMCASAEPGKVYGEFSFSPEVIAQARRNKPKMDAIDSSGPRE